MVRAWMMDNNEEDPRLEHHRNPPEFVDLSELFRRTGVEYFKVRICFEKNASGVETADSMLLF